MASSWTSPNKRFGRDPFLLRREEGNSKNNNDSNIGGPTASAGISAMEARESLKALPFSLSSALHARKVHPLLGSAKSSRPARGPIERTAPISYVQRRYQSVIARCSLALISCLKDLTGLIRINGCPPLPPSPLLQF